LNGQPAVILEVRRQSGANTVAVIEAVKSRLPELTSQLPADVKFEVIRDQSRYIYQALHEINLHLVLGSLLACLVVLAFMRDWRSTLIAAVAIPTSVISTFGMMWALGFTLNSVTMLALVLMVGIVIDDAIVVLENIYRFIEEKRLSPYEAAAKATAEIGLAVMATTFSLVVIFVPVSFMSSISGRFLYQFGITAAVAVLVSLLVSFTLTPMMSARLLQRVAGGAHAPVSRSGFYGWIERRYLAVLRWAMAHRWVVTVAALAVMASSVPLYGLVRQEYIPSDIDEGEFEVSITAPEGTSIPSMDSAMQLIAAEIRRVPGVETVLATTRRRIPGKREQRAHLRASHAVRGTAVHLDPPGEGGTAGCDPRRPSRPHVIQRDVMQDIRRRLKRFGLRAGVSNIASFNFGGSRWEIDFVFLGAELEKLSGYANALRERADELGIVDADTTLKLDKPEVRVEIDRDRAAALRRFHGGHSRCLAPDGGRRRRNLPVPRSADERGLRCHAAVDLGGPARGGGDRQFADPGCAVGSWCASTTWSGW
jgi:HAE1 family hydrophobic/amphiphilic exporter-1